MFSRSLVQVSRRATQVARRPAVAQQQVARFSAHREYHGAEKTMRHYLPEDHHVVLANLGAFFGIYVLYKVTQIGKKPAEAAPAVAAATTDSGDGEVPSLLDERFEEWRAKIYIL
mmetsp:Transcript_21202/g.46126  ORF Transcript_21202/g.46126 Transcript_21202/m.46126 type:complete len:115 (-) Transcript_21202:328-672(-)